MTFLKELSPENFAADDVVIDSQDEQGLPQLRRTRSSWLAGGSAHVAVLADGRRNHRPNLTASNEGGSTARGAGDSEAAALQIAERLGNVQTQAGLRACAASLRKLAEQPG